MPVLVLVPEEVLVLVLVRGLVPVLSGSSKGRVGETATRPGHYPIFFSAQLPYYERIADLLLLFKVAQCLHNILTR